MGGYSQQYTNLRQILKDDMKKNDWSCKCIRCREVKDNIYNPDEVELIVHKYKSSGGDEYFISYETSKYLIGFIRLRLTDISNKIKQLPILNECGLIRELHIYSTLSNVGEKNEYSTQHKGYGRRLIEKAEEISKENGFRKMAIIAGTGVRNYYRKFNYKLEETFMIKDI
jgi:elongator complex protein 3